MVDRRQGHFRNRRIHPQPFWTRTDRIAVYPLRGAALWSLVALTLSSALAMLPVVGWIIGIVTWLATYRYAFAILRHTANGYHEAPEHSLDVADGTALRAVVATGLLFLLVAAVAAATRSMPLTAATLVLVVLVQPGCTISLALDGSLRRALDPRVSVALATRIGSPYLLASGLLLAIQAGALAIDRALTAWLPPVVGDISASAVSIWGLFATFHLMGYLVFQYHEVLGFEPEALTEPDREAPDRRLVEDAGALIAAGESERARALLGEAVRVRAVALPVHEAYHRLLRGDRPEQSRDGLFEHARQYLSRLLDENQDRRALAVTREMLDLDPDFIPLQTAHAMHLVHCADRGGQHLLASDLLQAMLKRWPCAPQAPQWALQAAALLAGRFDRRTQARDLLQRALAASIGDEARDRLQAALASLDATIEKALPPFP